MNPVTGDFRQWFEHKTSVLKVLMRDAKARLLDHFLSVKEQVQIDGPRSFRHVPDSPEGLLYIQKQGHHRLGAKPCLQESATIQKIGLILDKRCFCFVQTAGRQHLDPFGRPQKSQRGLDRRLSVSEIRPQSDAHSGDFFAPCHAHLKVSLMHPASPRLKALVVALAVAIGAVSCGEGVLADPQGVVYLTPFNADQVQAGLVEDRPPTLDGQDERNYREVREQFAQRASLLLQRTDVIPQLESIEQVFLFSGHYLELIKIYEDHVREHGVDNIAGPSLAFAYIQLGQRQLSREIIQRLIEERPEDALTWAVAGAFHLQDAGSSTTAARQARDAFVQALEVDPGFAPFRGMSPVILRRQIEDLNRRLPDGEALALAEAQEAQENGREDRADELSHDSSVPTDAIADPQPEPELEPEPLEPEPLEEEATAEAEAPSTETPELDIPQERASHSVARGRADLQRGPDHLTSAQAHFQRALELEPENLDAATGLLLVAARSGAPEDILRAQVNRIAEHPALTARQAYELGLFSLRNLNDRDLAASLLERVRDMDPSFARRVDIDALLQR